MNYRFRKMPPRFLAELREFERWRRARGARRKAIVAERAMRPIGNTVHSPLCYLDLPPDFPLRAYMNFWEAVNAQRIKNAKAWQRIKSTPKKKAA
jgi:hypothetical protein